MTDQTKKREEGEKRLNRAAVIVAPTGSGNEEGKEGDACGGHNLSSIPEYGQRNSTRVNPEKKGSRKRDREKGRERAIASESIVIMYRERAETRLFFLAATCFSHR